MTGKNLHSRIPGYSMVILTLVFCTFTLGFENYSAKRAQARLEKHSMIIADDLWNFNSAGVSEYLKLAAEADHYETLEVVNHNGEIFQSVRTNYPGKLERFLIRLHLTPRVVLIAPVESKTNIIGWIEAIWIPKTIFVLADILLLLFMVLITITLYCRIVHAKHQLEKRVIARTRELAQANKTLQKEYRERLEMEKQRQLMQEQLEQSRKMESLGLLAGGVAHDLNNVLSGIVSYPDLLLLDMPEDNPHRKSIETIRNSGLRAADIVQDLLTLARRGVITKQVLDLNQIIREYETSPEHKQLLEFYPGVTIRFDLEEPLPTINGSPTGLKKIIMNLVSNGAEAQPTGGTVSIQSRYCHLETERQALQQIKPGSYIVLTVKDKGAGIDQKDLQRIFEPFYTKKVMGRSGTGLGLTVVWGTVEDHDGAINIDSSPTEGTTIEIYLPAEDNEVGPSEETEVHPERLGRQQTILVVDDVEHQRDIACAILGRLNYQTKAVASGEEAIQLLQTEKVDLLVLDMIMDGGIDGLETYQQICRIHPHQKAVIASGFSETERVQKAQELGAGACIKKPYTLQQLSQAVSEELEKDK